MAWQSKARPPPPAARAAMPAAVAIKALAEILRALGDFTRLRLVAALSAPGVKELCVCDLVDILELPQPARM